MKPSILDYLMKSNELSIIEFSNLTGIRVNQVRQMLYNGNVKSKYSNAISKTFSIDQTYLTLRDFNYDYYDDLKAKGVGLLIPVKPIDIKENKPMDACVNSILNIIQKNENQKSIIESSSKSLDDSILDFLSVDNKTYNIDESSETKRLYGKEYEQFVAEIGVISKDTFFDELKQVTLNCLLTSNKNNIKKFTDILISPNNFDIFELEDSNLISLHVLINENRNSYNDFRLIFDKYIHLHKKILLKLMVGCDINAINANYS